MESAALPVQLEDRPALAAGNTVVAKPSEITPYTAWRLGEICMEAGLPPGVLNIVHGTGPRVGEAIVTHPGIKAISLPRRNNDGSAHCGNCSTDVQEAFIGTGWKKSHPHLRGC